MRVAIAVLLSGALSSGLGAQQIARAAAQADLDTLRAVVHRYSAYRLLNGYPFDRHIDSLKAQVPDSVPLAELWHSVQTLIGRLQDAHSNVPMPAAVRAAAPQGGAAIRADVRRRRSHRPDAVRLRAVRSRLSPRRHHQRRRH